MDSKKAKAAAVRASAFELCREGKLAELRSLLNDQGDDVTPALRVKLSDRQDDKGKSGATLLHMWVLGVDSMGAWLCVLCSVFFLFCVV